MRSTKIPKQLSSLQMINHFYKVYQLTTKAALCTNIRKLKVEYEINPDQFFPRCYKLYNNPSSEQFLMMYKTQIAISLLKNFK